MSLQGSIIISSACTSKLLVERLGTRLVSFAVLCKDHTLPVVAFMTNTSCVSQEPLTSSSWEVGLGRVLLAAKKRVSLTTLAQTD